MDQLTHTVRSSRWKDIILRCQDRPVGMNAKQWIAEMTEFLKEQSNQLKVYDEQLVRRLIEKVTVFDDKLTIEFKSGVEIDI